VAHGGEGVLRRQHDGGFGREEELAVEIQVEMSG
jgi:hypothetical protein